MISTRFGDLFLPGLSEGRGIGQASSDPVRPVLEDRCKLDLPVLHRHGCLEPGYRGCLRWAEGSRGPRSICLVAELDSLVLSYRVQLPDQEALGDVTQRVALVRTRQHLAGERIWLRCPVCQQRCAALYFVRHFCCRSCGHLRYTSQHQPAHERLLHRAQAIRVRLGGTGSMREMVPNKPAGMRWSTYRQLCAKAEALDHASLLAAARAFGLPGFGRS